MIYHLNSVRVEASKHSVYDTNVHAKPTYHEEWKATQIREHHSSSAMPPKSAHTMITYYITRVMSDSRFGNLLVYVPVQFS